MSARSAGSGLERFACSGWSLFVIACVSRLLYLFGRGVDNFAAGDTLTYDDIATSLLAGRGFALNGELTAFRVPGYPIFLASTYAVFGGPNHLAVQLVQVVLGASVPLLLVAIGRELGDERVGWLAGWLGALHINLIFWTGYVLEENLFVPLLVLTFYLLLRARRPDSTTSATLAGLSMGGLLMARPAALAFVGVVPLWLSRSRLRRGGRLTPPLAALLFSTVLVLLPWAARNYAIFGRFVPICTCGGGTLWRGTEWDEFNRSGRSVHDPTDGLILDQFQKRQMYLTAFASYVTSHPLEYGWLAARKALSFWSLYFPQYSLRHRAVKIAFFGPVFVLSAVGLLFARLDREALALFWTLFLSTTLLHMITLVDYDGRYRLGVEAVLCVTAATGLFRLLDGVRPPVVSSAPADSPPRSLRGRV